MEPRVRGFSYLDFIKDTKHGIHFPFLTLISTRDKTRTHTQQKVCIQTIKIIK